MAQRWLHLLASFTRRLLMSVNERAIAGAILLTVGALVMTQCSPAKAQEHHMHGDKQADADWYDAGCCNNEDCRAIEASAVTYNPATRQYFWQSDLSGKLHVIHADNISPVDYQPRIRISRDGRYHGCERNTADKPGSPASWVAYCLYLPPLM
jgi:hypothetical protein